MTSCYLDVDGGHHARLDDCETELARLVRDSDVVVPDEDLERIRAHLRNDLDRSRTRGVAYFSCAEKGFWEVVELPISVRSQLGVGMAPALAQLEAVVQESERVGVVLADRQRARLVVFELGEVVEAQDFLDELPREFDTVGHRDHTQPVAHTEEMVAHHLRRVAREAFELFERCSVRHVVLGVPDALASALEGDLHPYLSERLRERTTTRVDVPADELRRMVIEAEHRFEAGREQAIVEQLRGAVHSGGRAVAGLADTLGAITDRRAEQLCVSDGFSASGWRCATCSTLAEVGRSCARCGAEMDAVSDIVAVAIDEALRSGCRVEVCDANADLDVLGRIGALLRY